MTPSSPPELPGEYVHEDRFWSKVDASGDCWAWTAASAGKGYGKYTIPYRDGTGRSKHVYAHRHAWAVLVGEIPEGMVIDHLCKNRKCVNPDHLEVVTTRINNLRGAGFAHTNARKTHCKSGHEFTEENTRHSSNGRACLTCHRAWDRARRPKNGRR